MEEDAEEQPLVSCSAIHLVLERLELHRGVSLFVVAAFVCSATIVAFLLSRYGLDASEHPCCCLNAPLVIWFGFSSVRRIVQPMRRGRLRLFPEELVFQLTFARGDEIRLPLRSIERLGRNRNRIHIRLRGENRFYFFDCSRLHAEDMYDQITAQLDELGVEVAAYESQRRR